MSIFSIKDDTVPRARDIFHTFKRATYKQKSSVRGVFYLNSETWETESGAAKDRLVVDRGE